MNHNSKKSLIIASVVAVILIIGLLIYYFVFAIKEPSGTESNQDIIQSNSWNVTSEDNNKNSVSESGAVNIITSAPQVDSNINKEMTAKIQGKVELLENVSISNIRIHQQNEDASSGSMKQDSTNSGSSSDNSQSSDINAAYNSSSSNNNQTGSVNIVLDLTINPESDDKELAGKEMETTSNYLAENYAVEMPEINVLILNYHIGNDENIVGEFTYLRSGSNLFLQEFTIN